MSPSLLPAMLPSLACLLPAPLADLLADGKRGGQHLPWTQMLAAGSTFAPGQDPSCCSRSRVLISSFPRGRKGVGLFVDHGARSLLEVGAS